MPEINKSNDIHLLEDRVKIGESLITTLKDEIKILMQSVKEKEETNRKRALIEENRKLQNDINLTKKELIKLQVSNGITQIPVPGEELESKENVKQSKENVTSKLPTESSLNDNLISNEKTSSEKKLTKPAKPKKQAAPVTSEAPVDVGRLDIRVGKVLQAQLHPDADGLYLEKIDIGEEIPRTVVSGLVKHIPLVELDGRTVVVLCNLKPQKMRGIASEAMVLCASTEDKVELLTPPAEAVAGDKITVPGYTRNPDLPFMNPKKKIFEKVAEDLKVNSNKQATYSNVPWEVEGKGGAITTKTLTGCQIK